MVRWFFCGAILLGCLCAPFENQGFGHNRDICLENDANCLSVMNDVDESNEFFSFVPEGDEEFKNSSESLKQAGTTEMVPSKEKSLLEAVLQQLRKKPADLFEKPADLFEELLDRIKENPEDAFNITAYFVMEYRMVETFLRTAVLFAIESQVLIGLNALAAVSGMAFLAPHTPAVSMMVTQMISFGIVRPLFEWMGDHARSYAKNLITPQKATPQKASEQAQPKLLSVSA